MSDQNFFVPASIDDAVWAQIVSDDLAFFRNPAAWVRANTRDSEFPPSFVITLQGMLDSVHGGFLLQGIVGTNVLAVRPSVQRLAELRGELLAFIDADFPVKHPFHVYEEARFAATHTEIFPGGLDVEERAVRMRNHLFGTASDRGVINRRLSGREIFENTLVNGTFEPRPSSRGFTVGEVNDISSVSLLYTSQEGSDAQACEAVYAGLDGNVIVPQTSVTKDYKTPIPPEFLEALERQAQASSPAIS